MLLLALSCGPLVRPSVSCVGGSVFLCGLFVPACPSARVAVVFLMHLFHGQRPKDRALRQVPPTVEYLIATSACRSLYWVLQSLSLTLSGLFVSPFLSLGRLRFRSGLSSSRSALLRGFVNMWWASPFHQSSSSSLLCPRSQARPNPAAYRGTGFSLYR